MVSGSPKMNFVVFLVSFGCMLSALTIVDAQNSGDGGETACGRPQVPPSKGFRIVGGGPAQNNSWPWICALVQEVTRNSVTTYRQFCDCTIIHQDWVITAAHCLEGLSSAQFIYYVKVYVGQEDLTKAMYGTKNKYNISTIYKHEGFVMKTKDNDVTLVRLRRSIDKFDNDTMPVCLPYRPVYAGDYVQTGYKQRRVCYIGGWGHTYEGEGKSGFVGSGTDKLKQTSAEIWSQEECKNNFGRALITSTMVCAGFEAGGRDTCQGDSGGPLVCDDGDGVWTLHGIVSWGPGCARKNAPGVYTHVHIMMDWVRAKTGLTFSRPTPKA